MSESTNGATPGEPVKITKTPAAADGVAGPGGAALAPPTVPPLPTTMKLVLGAIALQIVCGLVRAVSLRGSTAHLEQWLVHTNSTAKKPKSPYDLSSPKGLAAVTHDLDTLRSSALLNAIVIGLVLLVLAFALRRMRMAGVGRWALIIVMVLTQAPFYVVPIDGWPAAPKVSSVIFGIASIATIVLLLLPQSTAYFRSCKAVANPNGSPARPGLRDTFGSRGAAGRGATPRGSRPGSRARPPAPPSAAPPQSAPQPATRRASAKQKAKVRSDEAAVARGAELARSRAKASKSRRTEA